MIVLFLPAFAQDNATLNNATQGELQPNATGDEEPVLEQVSEKGIYKVLLRRPQDALNPQGAIQV